MASIGDIPSLVVTLSADLKKRGISHAITGAAAMAVHGYVRATRDIEILVMTPGMRLPEVFESIRNQGFDGDDQALIQSIRDRYMAVLESEALDVEVLVPAIPYHRQVLDRASEVEIRGTMVPVVTVEDLIVLKLLWSRTKDIADVEALVSVAWDVIDASYVEESLLDIVPADDERHGVFRDIVKCFGRDGENDQ